MRNRRSIRLRGYDYARNGTYFITICTQNRECLFGNVVDGNMQLNTAGEIVQTEWLNTDNLRQNVTLDAFVIMPNHIHGILIINVGAHCMRPDRNNQYPIKTQHENNDNSHGAHIDSHGAHIDSHGAHISAPLRRQSKTIGTIIAGFKSTVTKQINIMRETPGTPVWQRNYYEHIIRDNNELNRIQEYIRNNPLNWKRDRENDDINEPTDSYPQMRAL